MRGEQRARARCESQQTVRRKVPPMKHRRAWMLAALVSIIALPVLNGLTACRAGGSIENVLTVAMMPKNKGNPYFASCHEGAEEAAKELGVRLLWDGPTETD